MVSILSSDFSAINTSFTVFSANTSAMEYIMPGITKLASLRPFNFDRRTLLQGAMALAAVSMTPASAKAAAPVRVVETPSLRIGYEESGPTEGEPIFLLHGWPYDPRSFDDVVGPLAAAGFRVIVPYSRCFGPTVYRDATIFRSGEQAALGKDVIDLMDALHIPKAILAGFDWGNRAACVASALWPGRVRAFVSTPGYTILNVPKLTKSPGTPKEISQAWYRFFLSMPEGPAYLAARREEYTRQCWETWSPTWRFSDEFFKTSARSFQTDDWLATTVHCYRHFYGTAEGDPALQSLEERLYEQPKIAAPTIVLQAHADPLYPASFSDGQQSLYTGHYERRPLAHVGHDVPKEAPADFIQALKDIARISKG
jgi:pimeloyl-ACP methyl ester carboxylesterase